MTETKTAEMTRHVFEVYIKTTPEKLWQALIDGSMTEKYYYGSRVESDWKNGSSYKYIGGDGTTLIDGTVIESDPQRRLVTTFNPHWSLDEDNSVYPESRVTFEITPAGEACKLTIVHDELVAGNPMTDGFFGGWSEIISGLKTLLETGEPLVIDTAGDQ